VAVWALGLLCEEWWRTAEEKEDEMQMVQVRAGFCCPAACTLQLRHSFGI